MDQKRSRRKRKRNRRRRKAKLSQEHTQQILTNPGALQDANIAALVAKGMEAKTNAEFLEAFLQLEQHINPDGAHLSMPELSQRLSAMRAGASGRDKAELALSTDKEGFFNEVFAKADAIRPTGAEEEKIRLKASMAYTAAVEGARSHRTAKKLQLDWDIEHGPKEDVMATGNWITYRVNGQNKPKLQPDVVTIMHRRYVFRPGINNNVPKRFADAYRQLQRNRSETTERQEAMSLDDIGPLSEAGQMELAQLKIDRKYGVQRDTLT
jgi:hypothetical protein